MTTLLKDNFNGASANLAGHVPDISPPTFAWRSDSGVLNLDGAGKVIENSATFGQYRSDYDVELWTPLPTGTRFTVIFIARLPD
jgi:hypothetical protein